MLGLRALYNKLNGSNPVQDLKFVLCPTKYNADGSISAELLFCASQLTGNVKVALKFPFRPLRSQSRCQLKNSLPLLPSLITLAPAQELKLKQVFLTDNSGASTPFRPFLLAKIAY